MQEGDKHKMKKLVMLLVGGFVGISVAVALIPLVTGINLAAVTNPAALAVLTAAQWVAVLAAAVGVLFVGINYLRKRGR